MHVHPCIMGMQLPKRPEGGIGCPGTGVTVGPKPSCGCWESNAGTLEEQTVLLITERSAEPIFFFFLKIFCIFSHFFFFYALGISNNLPQSQSFPSLLMTALYSCNLPSKGNILKKIFFFLILLHPSGHQPAPLVTAASAHTGYSCCVSCSALCMPLRASFFPIPPLHICLSLWHWSLQSVTKNTLLSKRLCL